MFPLQNVFTFMVDEIYGDGICIHVRMMRICFLSKQKHLTICLCNDEYYDAITGPESGWRGGKDLRPQIK